MVLLSQSIGLLFEFPLHTERIGRLHPAIEFVFNTPSHHRVHHGANTPYLNKNYGGSFIVWDRRWGSHATETERIRYGLTTDIKMFNPIKVNFHEFFLKVRDVSWAKTGVAGSDTCCEPRAGSRPRLAERPPMTAPGNMQSSSPSEDPRLGAMYSETRQEAAA